ncbi:MAG: carbohydrate ABC transporter permease, partial [Chloroflexi bacterium]
MTAATVRLAAVGVRRRRRIPRRRIALYAFLTFMAVTWLFPLLWAVFTALRPYADTAQNGYISLPTTLNVNNFINAWNQANFPQFYLNSLIVAIPSVILVLFLASMVAFAVTRFTWRFNLLCLMLFTAGNLLPPQVIIVPLYRLYLLLPIPPPLSDNGLLYDQYFGIILIHIAFQAGFCVFVLSNYMKTLSRELTEAALVDGAPVWRIYWNIILPLCRPALAALATLEFTFIYNDFFWALLLMKSGDRRPITSALNNLQGQFFTDT